MTETIQSGTVQNERAAETHSAIETMPFSRALNAGLRRAMTENDRVLLMGEDIGRLGGVFRVTEGLQADFGEQRVLDTPLAESGIVGTAIGLAMGGFRPVCEIQFDGFVFPAFDQITSQLAKITNRHEGAVSMPVVIRIPYGGHIGAVEHHQESPEVYFTATGLTGEPTPISTGSGEAERRNVYWPSSAQSAASSSRSQCWPCVIPMSTRCSRCTGSGMVSTSLGNTSKVP